MLIARSRNARNGAFYTLELRARDIFVGAPERASFSGAINLPAMQSTAEATYVYLYQPLSGASQAIPKLRSDPNQPDPARCRLVCAFGTYNYADRASDWGVAPITFRQVGHDVFFDSDANVQSGWRLRENQQWEAKALGSWVPDNLCDLVRLRVELGAATTYGDHFVQANIASESNGAGSKEVKGRSPIVGNNKYVIDLIEVPLADRFIWCCGTNAIADILCAGYRLHT